MVESDKNLTKRRLLEVFKLSDREVRLLIKKKGKIKNLIEIIRNYYEWFKY
jgi:hypothetical protein